MLKIDGHFVGLDDAIRDLMARNATLKRAVVVAINKTGYAVIEALKDEMPRAFDRPVPYTINSLRLTKATAETMAAEIRPADAFDKGTPARKYLGPEIFGGDRHVKRSEIALRMRGILPAGMFTVPGQAASLDAYGNQSLGELRQILSYFGSAETHAGYLANMTDKTKARLARGTKKRGFGYMYFAVKTNQGNLAPGIYRKMMFQGAKGKYVYPVLMFVKKPSYTRRYRWNEVGGLVARQRFERYLAQELANAK
jgi:hypothetical protein